ncbi:type II toxin-antitoxin system RatA family toxin [Gluconobacter sp. R71646]|uniref:Type II toxin-antitoxin system RatA family toxin n=1 Tax=Gluconobacter potus TaxID=2724927 RepID=A0ABR9YNL4_9PROT|nr:MULTISPECIES: type II toxin-antitoxin system RatA family toxin [Gluconobacter]MBF0865312.1 type II toxin-antitoxin system RatA family toxin [Gluconobacter sp. R71656]MBF0883397.1 type II toxin-antitoxin system RatA family toxin [Gluconobacter potus]
MPTHAEQRLIAYTPDQLFDLVADVEKYSQFLPWCVKASIRTQTEQELVADLTIGFGPFRETFTSRVTLERPSRIRVRYEKGPFRYLNNVWTFTPDPRGCLVDFFVDFEFRSRLLQNAMGVVFNEGVRLMVSAFIKRARDIYGTQATKAVPPAPGLSQRT